ncbi:phenoloxidase subunit 1-like [Melitaea cinxia]|uniref:phenoloxidase subunit 1-like n=1 Tax=Melitaea cinxia TaxID=113334 RepID=UPI001E272C48|nr:phenoloxidase subunit 1-like [Melitaea cinxia]
MSECRKNLLLFFNRPKEPFFLQKGDDDTIFRCPANFYPEKFKGCVDILDGFGEDVPNERPRKLKGNKKKSIVDVRDIEMPNLSFCSQLPYNEHFSVFVPKHRQMAGKLIDIFMSMPELEDLQALCAYSQMRINPYMFNYCLSVAILNRKDTKGLDIPSLVETFPDKFICPQSLKKAREVSNICPPDKRELIQIPQTHTASDAEPEQRLAYFREDIGVNLHHWHWHLVYPFEGSAALVNKDRRGELFYYMHQQIIARYNIERFCNGLSRTRPYEDFRKPIEEGYFPKLASGVASRTWQPRFAGTIPSDINRPGDDIQIDVFDMEIFKERIQQAIENMAVRLPDNKLMVLDEDTGIDVLGNLIEASQLSPNGYYYGSYHNAAHLFISYSHDPDYRYLEHYGVMGEPATAMRDPVFYRLHAHIDDLFRSYKKLLPPYPRTKLEFPGVRISHIQIEGKEKREGEGAVLVGVLNTQWEQSVVDLDQGLDFTPRGRTLTSFTHLTHDDFHYVIEVTNSSGGAVRGCVRVFLAPQRGRRGDALLFEEQRTLAIELDKFTHYIPVGTSTIRRSSKDSSVTIPYERTFRAQSARTGKQGSIEAAAFDFCGCGWPHHMLIPKGTAKGYPMVLFCMITNWDEDKVDQDLAPGTCSDAASYCGVRDRKYPDRRPMGFPFDRRSRAATLRDFLTPNMAVSDCVIRFKDEVRIHGQKG